jgi:hypothetical protein
MKPLRLGSASLGSPLNVSREIDSSYQLDRGCRSQEECFACVGERTCLVLDRRTRTTVQEKRCKRNDVPIKCTAASERDRHFTATSLDIGLSFSAQPLLQASVNVSNTHKGSSSSSMPVTPSILVEVIQTLVVRTLALLGSTHWASMDIGAPGSISTLSSS